ncbi:molybdopterin guanine dinucleotide-containing S/N-oxide reductase [Nocardia sp. CDC186]|uniref:Molybdopterin guanine dinucleotide-containing S/N-oxide reductase n=1 Tax=Nocardia implantans TaxID=3108168 RepID=A0ABU6AXA6_9NOCA|nr:MULTISPECIES: molybdopterin guanine dinucleotide-containing S/N-oxide reductase [unclassified Nocardia]MBF6193730.1 molybdopterin guanine dinucleotide-containing S/N-oxide reductase [Nocardia beijingensis]MEA3529532.1 molybdopterin guanine dinucleotide-containing S/N-oxide reductase [Nocardia sp. CDC192]MEB3512118.1 molybdopterin guanine dinucleotide-containing S/N-oxide reductase [Nocardia sp. CDC186]
MTTHLTHWGAFEADSDGERLTEVRPWRGDPEPMPLIGNVASAQHHPTRIDRPYVRRGWLENGPGPGPRGSEAFVPVSWERALDLLAGELGRVYRRYGAAAVFGGSYGWASAGRFHHAQSQLHRFLNCLGGYVRHVNSYSLGTSTVLLPYVIGDIGWVTQQATAKAVLAEHSELVVAFGGLSPKNAAVSPGGVSRHNMRGWITAARDRGCRFVSISPLRDDTPPESAAEWIAPVPGTDVAMMLALAQVLDAEGLADQKFLREYTVGYDRFAAYLRGSADGVVKNPEWAEAITGVRAERIRMLAREMAAARTLVTVSWSLQRARHGEQPVWAGVVLAAMLGQIGLPGGGFGHGYGSAAGVGEPARGPVPRLPQGRNGVDAFIPVARIADMLLNPGAPYRYNGRELVYPDVRLVYWCGGNPFHHHQDLARLRAAFGRPDTVVVHDAFWTATARHADIVLPSTMSIERDDFGAGEGDRSLFAMRALTRPPADARDDFRIFAETADRLGVGKEFTEGRSVAEWLRHLYERWRAERSDAGHDFPDFDLFWSGEAIELPVPDPRQVLAADFRADPDRYPLATPSGKIEIFSTTIDGFGYADCPPHPVWLEPEEWLGGRVAQRFPVQLVANQPRTKLHSQLDVGAYSQSVKISGREPIRMHPADAGARGLCAGDIVRVFNDRGSCLAGLVVDEGVRPGVAQLSTGAWYDPDPADPAFCRHGNPNVLIADRPSSTLSQGCAGQLTMVQIERYAGALTDVAVLRPPGRLGEDAL